MTITPGLSIPGTPPKPLKTKTPSRLLATTTTPYRSVKDATFTSGRHVMTSATASFVNSAYTVHLVAATSVHLSQVKSVRLTALAVHPSSATTAAR